jgi:hypothetical protein
LRNNEEERWKCFLGEIDQRADPERHQEPIHAGEGGEQRWRGEKAVILYQYTNITMTRLPIQEPAWWKEQFVYQI